MRSSSGMSTISQACTILAFVIASEASRIIHNQATITAPPAAATIKARGQVVNGPCGLFDRYAVAHSGATCQQLANDNGITMDELLLMNPEIAPSCDNLVAGNSYCVGALGSEAHPAPILSCTMISDDQGSSLCSCNNNNYYGMIASPGTAGPCAWSGELPGTLPSPTSLPSSTVHTPTSFSTTITVPPKPTSTPSPVWNSVCMSTPSTCLSGSTGTDKTAYTTGCCNGCGPGGSCDLNGPANGPMTYVCNCGGTYGGRRDLNALMGNGSSTWDA